MLEELKHIKILDRKLYKALLLMMWFLGLLCIIPVMLFLKGISLNYQNHTLRNMLDVYEKTSPKSNVPSEERLHYYSTQANQLEETYRTIKATVIKQNRYQQIIAASLSALSFKERLFEVKQRLEQQANKKTLSFPDAYGLEEYETRLPQQNELPQLFFCLFALEDILTTLLDLPITSLDSVFIQDVVRAPFFEGDTEQYEHYSITIAYHGTFDAVTQLCQYIATAPYLFSIETINITSAKKNKTKRQDLAISIQLNIFTILP